MSAEVQLKPCPFCGGEARHDHPSRAPRVYCSRCGCVQHSPQHWNFRGVYFVAPWEEGATSQADSARLIAMAVEALERITDFCSTKLDGTDDWFDLTQIRLVSGEALAALRAQAPAEIGEK